MDKVDGMQKAFGPKAGAYGELYSVQADADGQAPNKPKLNKPHCGQVGKLDETAPEVTKAPSAVIAFRGQRESLSQALISLPEGRAGEPFSKGLPKDCASYSARVGDKKFKYATRPLKISVGGDDSLAYVTKAKGENGAVDFGVVTVRHGNVIMTLVSTGAKISKSRFQRQAEEAFGKVRSVLA